jgi:glycogen synthase
MRILYWVDAFPPQIGGVEVVSGQFVRALQRRGHEIVVFSSRGRPDLPDQTDFFGIPVHRFSFSTALLKRDLNWIKSIRNRTNELQTSFNPDLIHLNFSAPSAFFHLFPQGAVRAPRAETIHAFLEPASGHDSMHARVLGTVDWVVGVSEAMLREARRLIPEITPRSSVIHNALEMPDLEPTPPPFDAPRVLYAGRLVLEKGVDVVIDAFAMITNRFPKARLVIAGDGVMRQNLEQQVVELCLWDKVEFVGWVDPEKMPALMNSSTIVAMPSRWEEPFGLVALQAAQMARPIVATRVGGLPEIVLHEKTGLLIEKDDIAGLANALALLLEHPELGVQMGIAGRQRAKESFTMDRLVDEYQALYENLVAKFIK